MIRGRSSSDSSSKPADVECQSKALGPIEVADLADVEGVRLSGMVDQFDGHPVITGVSGGGSFPARMGLSVRFCSRL